jgi:hypothetical protein
MKQFLKIANVLTNLQWCHLGVDNLDKLVMIYKNWFIGACNDCNLVDGQKLIEFFCG